MRTRRIFLPHEMSPLTPTRVSIPFERGELNDLGHCVFRSSSGCPLVSQGRVLVPWSDGGVKWALFLLGTRCGDSPLTMSVEDVSTESQFDQAIQYAVEDGCHVIDTGKLVIRVPGDDAPVPVGPYNPSLIESVALKTTDGLEPILRGSPQQGFRITNDQGEVFTSSRVIETAGYVTERVAQRGRRRVRVYETGPLRTLLSIEGITGHDTYATGLEYVIKLECYSQSSLLRFEVVWRHADDQVAHWIKDIRFVLPFSQAASHVTYGLEHGYHTDRFIPGCAYRILQPDQHTYLPQRIEMTGQRTTTAWGTGHGRIAPGWMQARFERGRVSAFMRDFQREYPNEIRIWEDRLEFGLWPEDANERIAAMTILPPHPDSARQPELRHRHNIYDSLVPRPYWAFFDKDRQCLETVQGMQKGQIVWLDLNPDLSDAECHRRSRNLEHELNQATLDHESLRVSSRYRFVYPPDKGDEQTETPADRAAYWIRSNERAFDILGKWDAGDLIYMWFSPGFSKDHDSKHSKRRQHSRIDYWNNNEEEPIHGLLLHFLATADQESFRYATDMVRHFLDIDVQHYPHYGVHTHAAGHCFRGDNGKATDHFWCEGLIDYYLITGDPAVHEVLSGIIDFCATTQKDLEYTHVDLRTVSIYLMQCATYFELLEDPRLFERARELGEQLVAEQMPEGYFMNFGAACRKRAVQRNPDDDVPQSFHGFFNTLALEGLSRLYAVDPDPKWADAFLRCFHFVVEHLIIEGGCVDGRSFTRPREPGSQYGIEPMPNMIATGQLALVCPLAHQLTDDQRIIELCRGLVELIEVGALGPEYGSGWAGMGLEGLIDPRDVLAFDAEGNRVPATPENFAVQARPLMPSIQLRCIQAVRGWLHTCASLARA